MARPIPHPGFRADPAPLLDWAVKLTQVLKERFAPEDLAVVEEPAPVVEVVTGMILLWPTATPPAGWLECGTFVLRLSYPDLFTLLGTTYGSTGSTDFRLPNVTASLNPPAGMIWIIKT